MKKHVKNNLYAIKQIWKYNPYFICIELISTLSGILEPVIQVYFLQRLIEMVVDRNPLKEILFLVVFFTLLQGSLIIIFNYLNEFFFPQESEKIKNKLSLEYMNKLQTLDLECFDNSEYYDKYTRSVSEAAERPILVFTTLVQFLVCIFEIGTLITLMVTMDPVAIIIAIADVLLAVIWQSKKGSVNYEKNMKKTLTERLKGYMFSLFWGNEYVKELRTSNMSELAKKKYAHYADESLNISKKYLKKILKLNTRTAITNSLSFSIMYGYFAIMAYIGRISVGSIAALLVAVSQLIRNISDLFQYIPQFYQHSLYIENIYPILHYDSKIECKKGFSIDKIESIEFHDVGFTYPFTTQKVLDRVSFTVKQGEKLAIVGHNGVGKTTLFKLICRFYDVSEGKILINGTDIREYDITELRRLYGIVFQDYKLFNMTLAENLLCREYQSEDEDKIKNVLFKCDILKRIEKGEKGFLTNVSKEFDNEGEIFSGGEQQKLAVARTMLLNPEVFLMDEPSSALDPLSEDKLMQLMNEVSKEKISIMITHRLSNVCDADNIILLDSGKIKEEGTHQTLMKEKGLYFEMFETQSRQYIQQKKL